MPMDRCGLTKLSEECGEAIVVAIDAYIAEQDNQTSHYVRLEEELADVLAAAQHARIMLKLDGYSIDAQWGALEKHPPSIHPLLHFARVAGELVQIVAKKSAYPNHEIHPDGLPIDARLESTIAKLFDALFRVVERLDLNSDAIDTRTDAKRQLFLQWEKEST